MRRVGATGPVGQAAFGGVATAAAVGAVTAALRAFGPRSRWFAFVVVWAPMTWLGTLSRIVRPTLPAGFHRLRTFEADGRLYELLGIRVVKTLLRRGPLALFNPDLHLPAERTPERLAHLDERMRDAEAAHALLFVATLPVVGHAAARGWWAAAAWTLLFDVALNGYPAALQRYNRSLLHRRYPPDPGADPPGTDRSGPGLPGGGHG